MSRIFKNIGTKILKSVLQNNYRQGNYKDIFWVIGDGRSGTTWIADLINYRGTYRKMFEPYHPQLVAGMDIIQPHQYIRPDDANHPLAALSQDVFDGKFFDYRVDSRNRRFRYNGIVIKDIFANLFAKWATKQYPHIKTVLVIRNPFAVVLSKERKSDWLWLKDPLSLLNQQHLFNDHLSAHEDFIQREVEKNDPLLNQILIWSIIHYVPLRQFSPGQIKIRFYENVYANPEKEMNDLYDILPTKTVNQSYRIPRRLIQQPTRSAGKDSHIALGTSPINSWKNELDTKIFDQGMRILEQFGLDKIYTGESVPQITTDEVIKLLG